MFPVLPLLLELGITLTLAVTPLFPILLLQLLHCKLQLLLFEFSILELIVNKSLFMPFE